MCGRGLATRGNSLVKAQPQRQTSEGQPDLKEHKYPTNITHHASFVFFHYFSYRHFSCRKDRFTVIILILSWKASQPASNKHNSNFMRQRNGQSQPDKRYGVGHSPASSPVARDHCFWGRYFPSFPSRTSRLSVHAPLTARRHGSLPCSERFFSGYSGFPLSLKTNTFKFQFDLERTNTFQRVLMNSLVLRG